MNDTEKLRRLREWHSIQGKALQMLRWVREPMERIPEEQGQALGKTNIVKVGIQYEGPYGGEQPYIHYILIAASEDEPAAEGTEPPVFRYKDFFPHTCSACNP